MVVTSHPEFARTIRSLRDWGSEQRYHYKLKGYNYRLEGMQGAILRVKLRHLDAWTEARRGHAALYGQLLADSGIKLPAEMPYARHVRAVYALMSPHRDEIQRELQSRQIGCAIHYPFPIYEAPAHSDLGYKKGDFPNAERAAAEEISIPVYPELRPEQIAEIAEAVRCAVSRKLEAVR